MKALIFSAFIAVASTLSSCENFDPRPRPPKPEPGCICPDIYDPVCGSDGKTYGNECEAKCAGVKWTKGPCE